MGVELKDLVVKHERSFEELEGRIAVDAYNTLYQFLSIIRQQDGTPLMDSKGRITSHLSGLFYRTCNLLEKNILPIYVFDVVPSENVDWEDVFFEQIASAVEQTAQVRCNAAFGVNERRAVLLADYAQKLV